MNGTSSHVAIIGAGQLGSRHLQGLSHIGLDIDISVIDPNPNSLELAQRRYEDMPSNSHILSICYDQDITKMNREIDLAIIATNADVRLEVIENLLNNFNVNYFILEKVVFQSIQDFEYIMPILESCKIKTWVNCTRRLFPFFQKLRKETILSDSVRICLKGSSWGLASNTIHMLDLLAFLSGQTEISLSIDYLDNEVYESKRQGFIEFGGGLRANSTRGDELELLDKRDKEIFSEMSIEFNDKRFKVIELDKLKLESKENQISLEYSSNGKSYYVPLQSELTGIQVERILKDGKSQLTSLNESYLLHRSMLLAFNQHLENISGSFSNNCPIT